jgi:hypothetical protein
MLDQTTPSLEAALAALEAQASACLKGAAATTATLRRLRSVAGTGNLRELRGALDAAEQAATALQRQIAQSRSTWEFDEDAYFAGDAYLREVQATAQKMGVAVHEQDSRLYCYPSLVRVLPGERTVLIDRTRERRLRPSVLVAHLRDLQGRPARFRPAAFLESLHDAYELLHRAREGRGRSSSGRVVRLKDIYDVLTLLPGQSRDYSLQEFARDLYLLDQSGEITTRSGEVLTFEASTGIRSAGATITIVTQTGQQKPYYGIAFTKHG